MTTPKASPGARPAQSQPRPVNGKPLAANPTRPAGAAKPAVRAQAAAPAPAPALPPRLAAVDAAAKKYYSTYYGAYGEAFVRDIKRRVTAALELAAKNAGLKTATVVHQPIASSPDGRTLEGLVYAQSGSEVVKRAFVATLDPQGEVLRIETEVVS